MWIKICGNTRLEDCLRAAEYGADAVGFVFAEGKRTVTAGQVSAIVAHLPKTLEKIGVFTSRDAGQIAAAARDAGLTGIQLHGAPDKLLLGDLRELFPGRIIQVLHWRTDLRSTGQADVLAAQVEDVNRWDLAEAVLIDSQTQTASGGTGLQFDWEAAAPILRRCRPPVIAAGGLRPQTVARAIEVLRPWGVDVSSGVESSPGCKDPDQVLSFIRQAREAFRREESRVA